MNFFINPLTSVVKKCPKVIVSFASKILYLKYSHQVVDIFYLIKFVVIKFELKTRKN